jgi:hypothetical protein
LEPNMTIAPRWGASAVNDTDNLQIRNLRAQRNFWKCPLLGRHAEIPLV